MESLALFEMPNANRPLKTSSWDASHKYARKNEVADLAALADMAASQNNGCFCHSDVLRRTSTRTNCFLRRVAFRLRQMAIQTHLTGTILLTS